MSESAELRAGDWVEVRSREEILATLDARGELEALPFMPEMLQYCGRRVQVVKRAHKTCDPGSGLAARRMASAVHLAGVRCSGEAHGGCQAGCLIFWKQSWLRKPGAREAAPRAASAEAASGTEAALRAAARVAGDEGDEPAYVCQSTRLAAATSPLPWWRPGPYVEDVTSGNVRVSQVVGAALFFAYYTLAESGLGVGSVMRWAYDTLQAWRGGPAYPLRPGKVPSGARTPTATLDLRPGELVRVRGYAEIRETLDERWRNRGMYFDSEQVPFCHGVYRVLRRVERIIDETTGRMLRLRSDAVILDGVTCEARYAKCRRFCPRGIYPFWREIWLSRLR